MRAVLMSLLLAFAAAASAQGVPVEGQIEGQVEGHVDVPVYAQWYDPARDPVADFKAAAGDAAKQDKLVLMILGGDWCSWCHRLDKFISSRPELNKRLHEQFVVMKVNFSEDNENEAFISTLPEFLGYPHFFIARADQTIIGAQNTGLLEDGESYSQEAIEAFLTEWESYSSQVGESGG